MRCEYCQKEYPVEDERMVGQELQCPYCGIASCCSDQRILILCPVCGKELECELWMLGNVAECNYCRKEVVLSRPENPGDANSNSYLPPNYILGNYTIKRCVGIGGMGEVYLVRHNLLERQCALKLLRPSSSGVADVESFSSLINEARLACRIQSPNIIAVLDAQINHQRNVGYIVMEFVEGNDLENLINGQPMNEDNVLNIVREVTLALIEAAAFDVVHRDIKPANIMITNAGEIKLADLGIAKTKSNVPGSGKIIGTVNYAPPEQLVSSDDVDCRADIYSLGATMYHMLSGQRPFDGTSPMTIMNKVMKGDFQPLDKVAPGVSKETCRLVASMMNLSVEKRPANAKKLLAELDKIIAARSRKSFLFVKELLQKKTLIAGAAAVAVAVLAILGNILFSSADKNTDEINLSPEIIPETLDLRDKKASGTSQTAAAAVKKTAPEASPAIPSQKPETQTAVKTTVAAAAPEVQTAAKTTTPAAAPEVQTAAKTTEKAAQTQPAPATATSSAAVSSTPSQPKETADAEALKKAAQTATALQNSTATAQGTPAQPKETADAEALKKAAQTAAALQNTTATAQGTPAQSKETADAEALKKAAQTAAALQDNAVEKNAAAKNSPAQTAQNTSRADRKEENKVSGDTGVPASEKKGMGLLSGPQTLNPEKLAKKMRLPTSIDSIDDPLDDKKVKRKRSSKKKKRSAEKVTPPPPPPVQKPAAPPKKWDLPPVTQGTQIDFIKLLILLAWLLSGLKVLNYLEAKKHKGDSFVEKNFGYLNLAALVAGPLVFLLVEFNARFYDKIRDYLTPKEVLPSFLTSSGQPFFEDDDMEENEEDDGIFYLKRMFAEAISLHASDVYIDPEGEESVMLRFRVDGSLRTIDEMDSSFSVQIINLLKNVSGMSTYEHTKPQEGTFYLTGPFGRISLRAASVGAFNGEKMTLHILGDDSGPKKLAEAGLKGRELLIMEQAVRATSGMVLICGPADCGKTTTLYAMLNSVDHSAQNVISIENPIEHIIPGITQMEVNKSAGITFAQLLRNALPQNPDIICLSDIPDTETAQLAVYAAQTGHLVIATLSGTDNLSTIDRLTGLGIPLRSIAGTLRLVVSQRLVRKLCSCKKHRAATAEEVALFRKYDIECSKVSIPKGCKKCSDTGYIGRTALFDFLTVDENLRASLEDEHANLSNIRKQLERFTHGSVMERAGCTLVSEGVTSMEEILRVTSELND